MEIYQTLICINPTLSQFDILFFLLHFSFWMLVDACSDSVDYLNLILLHGLIKNFTCAFRIFVAALNNCPFSASGLNIAADLDPCTMPKRPM